MKKMTVSFTINVEDDYVDVAKTFISKECENICECMSTDDSSDLLIDIDDCDINFNGTI